MSIKGDLMQERTLDQFKVTIRLSDVLNAINNRFDDSDYVLEYLKYYRFIDTASGVWLDGIGLLLGLERPYLEREDIFTFKSLGDADDPTLAWSDISGSTGGAWTTLQGSPTGVEMDDDAYRALLKAKIFAMYSDPTIPNIYLFIKMAFNDTESRITVPTPGTVEVELITALNNSERRLLVDIAPVAAGYDILITNWP